MCIRGFGLVAILLPSLCAGGPRPIPSAKGENAAVEITAQLYTSRPEIQKLLGSDLGGYYVVVQVKITPKGDKKLAVWRDDFQLRTDRDGERAKPYGPSQIAGRAALIVSQTADGGAVMGEDRGPIYGGGLGFPGSGGGFGNSSSQVSNTARVDSGLKEKPNPLLATLNEKVLP